MYKLNLAAATRKPFAFILLICLISSSAFAQVSSVQFGKNRIQYHKYDWRFYQTSNFNVHFTEGGLELAKYVAQLAEEELPQIESFTEVGLQRRANIILYNSYDDMQATNIGLASGTGVSGLTAESGGETQLVNNKLIVYFNANHSDLRLQVRRGIARILVDSKLFGEDIGEIAGNATLLDIPKWLTDGYVNYTAQNWSVQLDDDLKNRLLANNYRNFYQLAFDHPALAGHAFWHFVANQYGADNVSYFMYLAILYKNLNTASQRIAKKKFKDLLADFMEKETEKYYKDIRGRRTYPKGSIAITEDVSPTRDFYHFAPNPNPRSYTYAVAEYLKGRYTVSLYENYVNKKVLVKNGVRVQKQERNTMYPVMAWDGKGSRLAVVYWEADVVKLLVYDLVNASVTMRQELPFDMVQDAQYFMDHKQLILSAVKNGHSDIYIWNLESRKENQITNDVWDDLDASFVTFPNKYGIIFSSNRPSAEAKGGDTSFPSDNRYNIFLADLNDKGGFRQITRLTNIPRGNARYPTQYNVNHFTFVNDENGVANRYAGFFTTRAEGLDTLVVIGDEILRNPDLPTIDSTLKAWERSAPDSIGFIAMTSDSTYTFPLTNYQSSLLETRIAGDKGQVSEVTQQSDIKMLYRLRVDSLTLRRRNVSSKPTTYMQQVIQDEKKKKGDATVYNKADSSAAPANFTFLGEFNQGDSVKPLEITSEQAERQRTLELRQRVLDRAGLYKYRLRFSMDNIAGGINNNLLLTRYQPYAGGSGPVYMSNGNNVSWLFLATLSDVMEDYRFTGGMKPGIDFKDNEYFLDFQNYRRRFDYGATLYRASNRNQFYQSLPDGAYTTQTFTTLYQGNVAYPFDVVKSVRLIAGFRTDKTVVRPLNRSNGFPDQYGLNRPDTTLKFLNLRGEYVHDNAIMKAQNIWNGLRWKVYMESIMQLNKVSFNPEEPAERQFTFNFGGDARYYYPIYRNFIWAVRGAADVSWGRQKLIYYLGGADGWLNPKFNQNNGPSPDQRYVYQTLALQMRGYTQNLSNGNNAVTVNSELRLPLFSTLLNRPINNALIRNFQLVQFIDLGTAWVGGVKNIKRPGSTYGDPPGPAYVRIESGGVGPLAGGYGFGARSTVFGYFVKVDAGWPMSGIFKGKPYWYFALGFDF